MKKFILALVALLTITASAQAMSYEQAKDQALFLTDKMAYELNLTDEQYEAAYEINLDYLMGVNSYNDVFGSYWEHRNLDLQYILLDWQYRSYLNCLYFYRPLYWNDGYWHFRIYARYPHRNYYFFGRPHFYAHYRGAHSWRSNGGRSWYHGRTFNHNNGTRAIGMKDRFTKGDYGRGTTFGNARSTRSISNSSSNRRNSTAATRQSNRTFGNSKSQAQSRQSTSSFGSRSSSPQSSTRETVRRSSSSSNRSFGNRSSSSTSSRPSNTFSPRSSSSRSSNFGSSRSSSIGSSRSSSPARSSSGSSHSSGGSSSHSSGGGSHFGHR